MTYFFADIIFEQERMIMDTYQEQCHHIFLTFLKLFLGHSNFNALPPILQFSPLKMKYFPISLIAIRSGKVRLLIQAVILYGPTDRLIIKAVVASCPFCFILFNCLWQWNFFETVKLKLIGKRKSVRFFSFYSSYENIEL